MNKADFSKRITIMLDELYEAYEYFCCYIHLYNKTYYNLNEMNRLPGFFQLILKSFLELFVLKLARLFDNDKESITLYKIPSWIEQNKELSKYLKEPIQLITDINLTLLEKKDDINSLKILRDKFLAHTDKARLTKNIWKEANISIAQFRSLISSAHEILNLCCIGLDRATPALGMGVEKEIDALIDIIKHEIH